MISHCPHCGRRVANDERVTHTRIGWVPVLCCATGDGPAFGAGETVYNHQNFYASVAEGTVRALLLGPYPDYATAAANVPRAKCLAVVTDYRAPWYAYGVASSLLPRRSVFGT